MSKLSELPNISTVNEEKLIKAGVDTPEKLKELGSKKAWMTVRESSDPGACLHMLYGLEGAVQEVNKSELAPEVKAELKKFHDDILKK